MTLKVGGFPEYTPGQQLIFDDLMSIIAESYKKYGFVHIETPAVERDEVLLKGGEESSKQVFGLYGMAQGAEDLKGYGLHFDLTVPFTRYVIDHAGELTFPFKRHQIQPVWRGERSQKGRFRQFYQADLDVIWRHNENLSYLYYDAETLYVLNATLAQIKAKYFPEGSWVMHINNRNIISGFFDFLTEGNTAQSVALYSLFDDYYKIGEKKFENGLQSILGDDDKVSLVIDFTTAKLHELDERFGDKEQYLKGVKELQEVFLLLDVFNQTKDLHFYYDPFIVRGLDYYTGTVFEVLDSNNIGLGSLSGGGRYDNLAQSIDPKAERFDGVGGSIGLSRLTDLVLESQTTQSETHVDYFFVNFDTTNKDVIVLAQKFISEGHSVEIYPEPIKLAKQFAYADKKGMQKAIIVGDAELEKGIYLIKDLKTGEITEKKI